MDLQRDFRLRISLMCNNVENPVNPFLFFNVLQRQ